ncbi:MAG: hypothetical protein LAO51_11995 [Acidobacteriia bacterium]|nr:hypothetical protein [Terriglobia bacterium]
MLSAALWKTYFRFRDLASWWADTDRFLELRPDAARRDMAGRLLGQVRHFASRPDALPEWKDAAKITEPEDLWRLWPSLPILQKEDLRTRFNPSEMIRRMGLEGVVSATGGSTGEPTPYLHDRGMLRATTATRLYCRLKFGWTPGMATVGVWGSERDIGKQRSLRNQVSSRLRNDWMVDGYALDQGTVDAFLGLLRRHRTVAVFGFSSMLEFVARETLARGDGAPSHHVRTAWNGGEMLYEPQSALFERAFDVPIRNLYGGRELGAMAYQWDRGRSLRVLRPWVLPEIVDDDGKRVSPGESGRLVFTSTVCRGTPFLRYDIGDIGRSDAHSENESGIVALKHLEGRSAGLIRLPDGRTVSCLYWNHLFKEFHEVRQFQIVGHSDCSIDIRLLGDRMSPDRDDRLRATLREFLGPARFSVTYVDALPRSREGKLQQTLREP